MTTKSSSFLLSLFRNFRGFAPVYTRLFLISKVRTLRFVSNFTIKGHQNLNS